MAYRNAFEFKFASQNGVEVEIDIQQDGPIVFGRTRHLGGAPVLRMQENGPIRGTSLSFLAECRVNGEYAALYTSNPKDYRVELKYNGTVVWTGYIVPELYSEPDVAPPYDVQITATDGLGDLKLYDYEPQGAVTLRAQLQYLLGVTGLSTDINLVSNLAATLPVTVAKSYLLDRPAINLDYMAGHTCYEVLTHILESLHAVLFWRRGVWWLVRETDLYISPLYGLRYTTPAGGSSYNTEAVKTAGQLGVADLWPVGYGTTTIEPAKKSITVQAPWHLTTPLKNAAMDSAAYWIYYPTQTGTNYDRTNKCFYCDLTGLVAGNLSVSQTISNIMLQASLKASCRVSVKAGASSSVATMSFQFVTGGLTYTLHYDNENGWQWVQGYSGGYTAQVNSISDDGSAADTFEITIPPFIVNGSYAVGNLICYFGGTPNTRLYSVDLVAELGLGYQTRVNINNGARGSAELEEITGGRTTLGTNSMKPFFQGIYVYNDNALTAWKTDRLTLQADLLTIMAQDYALSIAAPRLLYRATLNSPSGLFMAPIILTKADINYFVKSFDWNLFDDEISVEAISLPSVELTIESQEVEPITD